MELDDARARFRTARVARLATLGPYKQPHLVPITFVLGSRPGGDAICFAVDNKAKSTRVLKRLHNIARNPSVSVLVDAYSDDWSELWWVRADGDAVVLEHGDVFDVAIAGLCEKYPQYAAEPPAGPVVVVDVSTWRSWEASDPAGTAGEAEWG